MSAQPVASWTLAQGYTFCGCEPGARCGPCAERSRVRVRLITSGGDRSSMGPGGVGRIGMTHEEVVDLRDAAWTARDLAGLYVDRDRTPVTWWELEWNAHYSRLLGMPHHDHEEDK